ncbi:MAG: hypothetical protein RL223_1949 [Pseudomonadota bacterium]|jgi:KDO II ethanolaminephosphotransferase
MCSARLSAAARPPGLLPVWAATALWIGALLNLPTAVQRHGHLWRPLSGPWPWLGPLAEGALMLGLAGALLALAGLAGRHGLRLIGGALLLVSAITAHFMARYQVIVGHGVVNAVLTTDHALSVELIDHWVGLWVLGFGLLPLWLLWRATGAPPRGPRHPAQYQSKHQPPPARGRLRCAATMLLAALASLALAAAGRGVLERARDAVGPADAQRVNLVGVALHSYLPANWLAGTAMVLHGRWQQARDDAALRAPARLHRHQPSVPLDDLVVVLVIGETTRSDRLGLLGHRRDTTPHLSRADGVAAFAGWSCDTSTKLSLACMFVRPQGIVAGGPGQPDRIVEDNVFSVYRQLGFRIELYAMQSEAGFYGRVRPDHYKLREVIAAQPENQRRRLDDGLLVPELARAVRQHPAGRGPQLVVLHTKGSHADYRERYPRSHARWTPECTLGRSCSVEELFNAFDNSVLYADQVLHELRQSLAGRKALMVWVPDHGESIDENRHFHATPRHLAPPEQRRVPLVFWASPEWRGQPELARRFERLQQRARAAATLPPDNGRHGHHNLYASLLGCIGIDSPDGGIPEGLDLCR